MSRRPTSFIPTLILITLTTTLHALTLNTVRPTQPHDSGIIKPPHIDGNVVTVTNNEKQDINRDTESDDTNLKVRFDFDGSDEAERYVDRVVNADLLPLDNTMVNQQQFTFLRNNEARCSGDVFILALIKSAPPRFMERQDIRKTWGSKREYKGIEITYVFTMGKYSFDNSSGIDDELRRENTEYGDIIQGDFTDHYKNQTYKTIMGMSWAHRYCAQAKYILNTNDNIMVDIYHLVDFLKEMTTDGKADKLLYCSTFFDQGPVRNPNDDNYITLNEYPYDKFPPHCEGFGYVMSKGVSESLLEAARSVPHLWLDDVYTTGFLPLKAGVKHCDMMSQHSYKFMHTSQIDTGVGEAMFLVAKYRRLRKNWERAWDAIEANKSDKK